MFKKILTISLFSIVGGALVFGAINRTLAQDNHVNTQPLSMQRDQAQANLNNQSETEVQEQALTHQRQEELHTQTLLATGELTEAEAQALLYMREEEKLAYDVYTALYAQWGLETFQTIASSELAHMEAIKGLLDRYGLDDPASATPGVFSNPELQALYDSLIARGSQSLAEAIKVGGAIEEIDILDLEERLAQTDNPDIQRVFNNLLNGSKSHLRAFAAVLQRQGGEVYQPQYMTAEQYQAIMAARGGNGRGAGGQGQGGQGQGAGGQGL
jgi:hypothetical protein